MARRFSLLCAYPLVFGAFLHAPKSDQRNSLSLHDALPIWTQRSLFHRIPRSFDPPNMSKRRWVASKRAVRDPVVGPLPQEGATAMRYARSALVGVGCSLSPSPDTQIGGLGARPWLVVSPFCVLILWFSGLFSMHRSRTNATLFPFTTHFRYGHNGPCFIGFRGRLTLQTCQNVNG